MPLKTFQDVLTGVPFPVWSQRLKQGTRGNEGSKEKERMAERER